MRLGKARFRKNNSIKKKKKVREEGEEK